MKSETNSENVVASAQQVAEHIERENQINNTETDTQEPSQTENVAIIHEEEARLSLTKEPYTFTKYGKEAFYYLFADLGAGIAIGEGFDIYHELLLGTKKPIRSLETLYTSIGGAYLKILADGTADLLKKSKYKSNSVVQNLILPILENFGGIAGSVALQNYVLRLLVFTSILLGQAFYKSGYVHACPDNLADNINLCVPLDEQGQPAVNPQNQMIVMVGDPLFAMQMICAWSIAFAGDGYFRRKMGILLKATAAFAFLTEVYLEVVMPTAMPWLKKIVASLEENLPSTIVAGVTIPLILSAAAFLLFKKTTLIQRVLAARNTRRNAVRLNSFSDALMNAVGISSFLYGAGIIVVDNIVNPIFKSDFNNTLAGRLIRYSLALLGLISATWFSYRKPADYKLDVSNKAYYAAKAKEIAIPLFLIAGIVRAFMSVVGNECKTNMLDVQEASNFTDITRNECEIQHEQRMGHLPILITLIVGIALLSLLYPLLNRLCGNYFNERSSRDNQYFPPDTASRAANEPSVVIHEIEEATEKTVSTADAEVSTTAQEDAIVVNSGSTQLTETATTAKATKGCLASLKDTISRLVWKDPAKEGNKKPLLNNNHVKQYQTFSNNGGSPTALRPA